MSLHEQDSSPKKRVKQAQMSENISDLYTEEQLEALQSSSRRLTSYPRNMALLINQQEQSIAQLNSNSLDEELSSRVKTLIELSRHNNNFIQQIVRDFQDGYNYELEGTTVCSHAFQHQFRSACNVFELVLWDWCPDYWPQRKDIQQAVDWIRREAKDFSRLLCIGVGTGRILMQLSKAFSLTLIQGHQYDSDNYLCSQFMLSSNRISSTVYPYIHNLTNWIKADSYKRPLYLPEYDSDIPFPITFGEFTKIYRYQADEWSIVVTNFTNMFIKDILQFLKVLYRIMKPGALWIDIGTVSFERHSVLLFRSDYQNLIEKSQFKTLCRFKRQQKYIWDDKCLLNEFRTVYYALRQK